MTADDQLEVHAPGRAMRADRRVCVTMAVAAWVVLVLVVVAACGSSAGETGPSDATASSTTAAAEATSPATTTVTVAVAVAPTVASAPGYSDETPDGPLHRGLRGPRVLALQGRLTGLGYDPGPSDGLFGAKTDAAVRKFQRDSHLQADGVVGPKTAAALDAACHQSTSCPPG
jgi:peptidoglycan hydrolase-like protein with peptidoglycan-binding domain